MWFKVFEPKTQISDIFLIMIETKCDAGAVCASWGGPVTRVEEGTARVEAELARVKEGGRTCWGGDHVRRDGSRVCWGGGLIFCQESQCNFCIYLDWYKYSAQPELENEYHVFWFWSLIWILNLTVTCQIECARPVPTFFHKQCPCSFHTMPQNVADGANTGQSAYSKLIICSHGQHIWGGQHMWHFPLNITIGIKVDEAWSKYHWRANSQNY